MLKRNSHWINAIKEDYELVTGITNRAIEKKNSKEKKNVFTKVAFHKHTTFSSH